MPTMTVVLVTGSSGFIGRALARALRQRGDAVHGLDPVSLADAGFPQYRDDLGSLERAESLLAQHGIESVVHAGGVSGPAVAPGKPHFICRENIAASVNLFEACRRTAVKRVVSISSAAALGSSEGQVVPDDAPLRPADVYGSSKASVELILSAYASEFGMSATSLRMPTIYGPGMPPTSFIARMIAAARAGQPFALSWGRGYACPYLFIDDAVAAICAALSVPALGRPVYNIAGAEFVATETIIALVAKHFPGATITMGDGPPVLGYKRGPMSIDAASRELGFRPRVGMESGIQSCIEAAASCA